MAAVMAAMVAATPAPGPAAILAKAAMETKMARAEAVEAAAVILVPTAMPAAEAQGLLDRGPVASMHPPDPVVVVVVVVKAVVVVKMYGSASAVRTCTAATTAAVPDKAATAAHPEVTGYIEVVEDVFGSSGEQEEAFLQQAQEICDVIINGKYFV